MKPIVITEEYIADQLAIELDKIAQQADESTRNSSIEYRMAKYAALNVDFIDTVEELRLYTNAIYNAVMWGKGIS